jgi:hypothetical protein
MSCKQPKPSHRVATAPFVTLVQVAVALLAGVGTARAESISLVDTLGGATPNTMFSVFGSGGISVLENQFVGPQFVLAGRTVVTEIGGLLNNCKSIGEGIPNCTNTSPFRVEIRPSVNGVPDRSHVLASVPLSDDRDPLRVSFESASLRLPLGPGSYFALFAPEPGDAGYLLGHAQDPFGYEAGLVRIGVMGPEDSSFIDGFAAVRVLGETNPIPEPSTFLLLGGSALGLIAKARRTRAQFCINVRVPSRQVSQGCLKAGRR